MPTPAFQLTAKPVAFRKLGTVSIPATKTVIHKPVAKKVVTKVATKQAPVPKVVREAIEELQEAWLLKNTWTRIHKAREEELRDLLEAHKIKTFDTENVIEDVDGEKVQTKFHTEEVSRGVSETIDLTLLKKAVTPEIFALCCIPQKGLIREHAGEAVLTKCLVDTPIPGRARVIEIKKASAKEAKK